MTLNYFEQFIAFVEVQDKFTAAIYLIIAKAVAGVLFIPGTPLTLLSGVVLGTFWGSIVSIIGNTIGAVLAFLLARFLLHKYVQTKLLPKFPKIDEYEDKLFRDGFWTVIFLRLVPLFPFNALNFILGVTELKFKHYFWGTFLGIIPGTILFVYLGESFKMLSFLNIGLAVLGIVGLGYIGKFWKK